MANNPLSASEIGDIIKVCGIYRVSKLKLRGLEVEFHASGAQSYAADQIQILERQIESTEPRTIQTGGEKFQTMTEEQKKEELDEFFTAQRIIDDPMAHEEALVEQLMQEGSA